MKRPRPLPRNDVLLAYPKRLLLINDMRKDTLKAYILQPLLADECGRLLTWLRHDQSVIDGNAAKMILSILCDASGEDPMDNYYASLNHICLSDTQKNKIAHLEEVPLHTMHTLGALTVEYLYVKEDKKKVEPSPTSKPNFFLFSASSESSEEEPEQRDRGTITGPIKDFIEELEL